MIIAAVDVKLVRKFEAVDKVKVELGILGFVAMSQPGGKGEIAQGDV